MQYYGLLVPHAGSSFVYQQRFEEHDQGENPADVSMSTLTPMFCSSQTLFQDLLGNYDNLSFITTCIIVAMV